MFAHVVGRPEAEGEIDLAQAALVVGEAFEPGVDVAYYGSQLERLGDEARRRVAGTPSGDAGGEARARRLLRLIYEETGFAGNRDDYYDPKNSFLHQVIERRVGIPITLAVLFMEVARHAGITALGVGFPGHFLVRMPGAAGPIFIDPFGGRILTPEALRALHAQIGAGDGDLDERVLAAVGKRQILTRLLTNLRAIYRARSDETALRKVTDRLAVLVPGGRGEGAPRQPIGPSRPPPGKLPN